MYWICKSCAPGGTCAPITRACMSRMIVRRRVRGDENPRSFYSTHLAVLAVRSQLRQSGTGSLT